jgi:hypothetical protein
MFGVECFVFLVWVMGLPCIAIGEGYLSPWDAWSNSQVLLPVVLPYEEERAERDEECKYREPANCDEPIPLMFAVHLLVPKKRKRRSVERRGKPLSALVSPLAPRPWPLPTRLLEPSFFHQQPPKQKLDLPVQAPQVVVGPFLERLQHLRIDPQQKRLPLSHRFSGKDEG